VCPLKGNIHYAENEQMLLNEFLVSPWAPLLREVESCSYQQTENRTFFFRKNAKIKEQPMILIF